MHKNDYIKHYGILGMHWGIQNGPPYPLSDKEKTISELKYYDPRSLSMEDLRERIQRYETENKYSDLASRRQNPFAYDVSKLLEKYGDRIVSGAVVGTITGIIAMNLKSKWGIDMKAPPKID